ncbi:hypothetical protein Tco_1111536 [Tanacetum coccineum]|uniref:Uncharacterized protein n=1 Tax=Tanacetum coccineum TaxID=301880 RepID=A0ABQ5IPC9_9ASTR
MCDTCALRKQSTVRLTVGLSPTIILRREMNAARSVQKDEEILLLKTQLADAQAEAESSRSYAQKLAEEKMALLVKRVRSVEKRRRSYANSIEYDEELYPHMLSAIAERRWLISHGLRLAAMSALESQEVKQSFGDVVKCALARGKAEAVEELHEKKLLTVPAPGGVRPAWDYFHKPDVRNAGSLEAHAIRLAKKKGVKGKAILCGIGAAHIPRSDGVPVSVATVSPKDSELLGKLEEAGDAAYQVGSSEQSRCHSI